MNPDMSTLTVIRVLICDAVDSTGVQCVRLVNYNDGHFHE